MSEVEVERPEDAERHATNLELFLDLAFVFALTQIASLISHQPTTTGTAKGFLIAPLTFASNAFVPTSTMPDWLRWWAERQPLSITVRGVRALMLGTEPMDYVWGSIAWSLVLTALLAPLAVRRFRNS